MTDITSSFLQQVSACLNVSGEKSTSWNSNSNNDKNYKNRILKTPQKKLPFVVTALEISKNITGLQNFLKEHKSAYLDTSAKYISSSNFMTEDQKDDIDREAVSTIDKCKSGISSLQHSLMEYKKRRTAEGDLMNHFIGIVDILQHNLMHTASTFKKYKKERIRKKMQEAEGYFKLDAIKRNPLSPLKRGTSFGSVSPETFKPRNQNENKEVGSGNGLRNRSNSGKDNNTSTSPTTSPLVGRRRSNSNNKDGNRGRSNSGGSSNNTSPNLLPDSDSAKTPTSPRSPPSSRTPNASPPSSSPTAPLSPIQPITANNILLNKSNNWLGEGVARVGGHSRTNSKGDFNSSAELLASEESIREEEEEEDDGLLESERELLEAENASLQREFDTMADQVRVIDQQLVAVSTLFDELTEHALGQKETMDTISDMTESAIGHTKRGVGQLQVASKRTVDFRLMVLLFLITCSVSLLFLHWYES